MPKQEIAKLDFSRKMLPWVNIVCIKLMVRMCNQKASMKVMDNAKPKLKLQITCRRSQEVIQIRRGKYTIHRRKIMATRRPKN